MRQSIPAWTSVSDWIFAKFLLRGISLPPTSSPESKIGLHTYFLMSLDLPKPGGILYRINIVACRASPVGYSRERQPKPFLLSRNHISQNWSAESKIGLHTYFLMSLDLPNPGGIFDPVNIVACRASSVCYSRPNINLTKIWSKALEDIGHAEHPRFIHWFNV